MAKLLFLVVLLVAASSVVAHTPPPSHPPPAPVHAPPLPVYSPPLPVNSPPLSVYSPPLPVNSPPPPIHSPPPPVHSPPPPVHSPPPPVHAPPPPVHAPPPPVHVPPPPKPVDTFSLKCVIHNIADRSLIFTLEVGGQSSKKVVAEKGCWTTIAPVTVSCKAPVVHLSVTVKTNKGVSVTKSFPIPLLDQFKLIQPKSLKVLSLLAYDTLRPVVGKFLEIEIGHKKILSFKL